MNVRYDRKAQLLSQSIDTVAYVSDTLDIMYHMCEQARWCWTAAGVSGDLSCRGCGSFGRG